MTQANIRLTRPTDINAVKDIDLKAYHYPLPLEEWQARISGSGKPDKSRIVVTEALQKPIAYAMWCIDKEHNGVHLERVGVLPKFRRKRLGSRLITACVQHGYDQFCEEVRIIVPSIHCCPGHIDDVSVFLNKNLFKPSGEIVHDMRKMYGKTVDGYIFVRPINVNPSRL